MRSRAAETGGTPWKAPSMAALLGLVLGGLIGFAAGRSSPPTGKTGTEGGPAVSRSAPPAPLEDSVGGRVAVTDPLVDPASPAVQDLPRRTFPPREAGRRPETPPAPGEAESRPRTPREAKEEARQIFDDFLRLFRGKTEDVDDLMRIAGRLDGIDEDLASHFAERFREAVLPDGDPKVRETALFLAVLAGGDDAARLLEQILTDPDRYPDNRESILRAVGRPGDLVWSLDRVPPTGRTVSLAYDLLSSQDPKDRRAGAGLLRGVHTLEARLALERTIEMDTNIDVRLTAIASLGEIGDETSLFILEGLLAPPGEAETRLMEVCRKSMERIQQRLR